MVPAALDVYYCTNTGFACTRDEAALCEAWSCPCMEDMDVHARQSCGEAAMPRKASCLELLVRAPSPRGRCSCHLPARLDMRASENGIACEQMLRCALSVRIRTANQLAGNGGPSSRVPRFTAQHVWSVDERIVAKPACAGERTL